MHSRLICVTILLIIAAHTEVFAADRMPKLAVMEIEDATKKITPEILPNATEYLRAKIAASGKFIVIDKARQNSKMLSIIREKQAESYKECVDKQCQIPLGQALAADTILRSSITGFGGNYLLNCELVDLAKEATVKAANAEFDGTETGLKNAVASVAAQFGSTESLPQKQPEKKTIRPYFWYSMAAFGVSALSLGSAVLFDMQGADAAEKRDALASQLGTVSPEQVKRDYDGYQSDVDSASTMRLISYISAGVFALAGGGLLWITEEEKPLPVTLFIDDKKVMVNLSLAF